MFTSRRIATMGGDKFRDEFSLDFTTDDYIATNFIPNYIHTNATMGMWVKFNTIKEQTMGHHGGKRWYMGINGSAELFMGVQDQHSSSDSIDGGIVANKWFHFVVTAIDGTATFYVDGVAKGTKSYTQDINDNPDEGWFMGARNNNGTAESYMEAKISEVFHYDVGLTASQVRTLYNGREPYNHKEGIATGNLKAWWRMGDGTLDTTRHFTSPVSEGGVVSDESQNSYLGTDLVDDVMNASNWNDWGDNTVELDGGAIKITAVDDGNPSTSGAYFHLRDNDNQLTTDLTIGKVYKVSYQVKVNSGSIFTAIGESGGFSATGNTTTSTSYVNCAIYIMCTSTTDHYFYAGDMAVGEIVYYTNIKVQEVVGNTGVIVNMASNQFSGDTP